MAQYKVIQDIEAEDKLLGPLSLRQFIYAILVVVMGFIAFKLLSVAWYLALPFLPPMLFFGLLAAPFGRDQPTEVWLLAKIRFFIKPRKRIWDQSGLKELVTITVPKKVEKVLTKGFSQEEVRSRLNALASTLDTRGWALKNVDARTFQQPAMVAPASDRLIDISSLPQQVPAVTVDPTADVLDETNNPIAQQVDQKLAAASSSHRQELLTKVRNLADQQKQQSTAFASPTQATPTGQTLAPDEQALLQKMQKKNEQTRLTYAHMRKLEPAAAQSVQAPVVPTPSPAPTLQAQAVTPTPDPGILNLVTSNDLNVATIARQAHKQKGSEPPEDQEVVISLR
jgi:hypothetical protein